MEMSGGHESYLTKMVYVGGLEGTLEGGDGEWEEDKTKDHYLINILSIVVWLKMLTCEECGDDANLSFSSALGAYEFSFYYSKRGILWALLSNYLGAQVPSRS